VNSQAQTGSNSAGEQPAAEKTGPVTPEAVPNSAQNSAQDSAANPASSQRRRSRQAHSQIVVFMNFVLSLVVLVLLAASALFYFGRAQFDANGPLTASTTFFVKRGAGISEVANGLESRGIVSDARIFRYGVRTLGHEDDLKAGEYAIPAGASMREVMNILISGKSIVYPLTIPEGLTVKQIFDRIAADPMLSGPMPKEMPPEGSLFTDTLNFTRGTPRTEIIERMMAAQKKLVDELWASRKPGLPLKDENQFVTLASIVEKETGIAAERPHVASVFLNRLKKGMRLQSDPTIIYGLFGGAGKPADRPIFKSDIEKPTPYNTYIINGLPPGPIANPGKAALEAVANPLDTQDLYFVADGTGGHVFSSTLKQHNENVRKWRETEQQKGNAGGSTDGPGSGSAPAQ